MPMSINVGVSRKVADNNYGSRGASVNLEVELDSTLIQEPERLQERIRQVFRLAQQSVDEELARQNAANGHDNGQTAAANGNGNGRQSGNGNGRTVQRRSNSRRATASQARALHAIADRQGLDLAAELQNRFGVASPEELSITEASQTIDELKSAANGKGRR